MKTFEEIRGEYINILEEEGSEREKLENSLNTKEDILNHIYDNWQVYAEAEIFLPSKFLKKYFTENQLNDKGIFTTGFHYITDDDDDFIFAYICGDANVTIDGYKVIGYTTENSIINTHGGSFIHAFGDSIIKANDRTTVCVWNDNVIVKAYDDSIVEVNDCKPTIITNNNSYVKDYCGNQIKPSSLYSIVNDCKNHILYLKKGAFKIVETD